MVSERNRHLVLLVFQVSVVVFLVAVFSGWPWQVVAHDRCGPLVWRGAGYPPPWYGTAGHHFEDGIRDPCVLMHRLAWDVATASLVIAGACCVVLFRRQLRRLGAHRERGRWTAPGRRQKA